MNHEIGMTAINNVQGGTCKMDLNRKPGNLLAERRPGKKKHRNKRFYNYLDYTKSYEAELKKFAKKYPNLVGYMVGGDQ